MTIKKSEFRKRQDAWLRALESGKYKQGTKKLTKVSKGVERDCCLGVACKVAMKLGLELVIDNSDPKEIEYDGAGSLPPDSVVEFFGLRDDDGTFHNKEGEIVKLRIGKGKTHSCLVSMNDNGITHKQIAAFIRANREKVFAKS